MNPPQNIDMSLITEALQRRSGQATQQFVPPTGQLPTGGANVPQPQQAPGQPQNVQQNVTPGQQAAPVSPEGAVVGKLKQGAQFDDETRATAKALVSKLIGVL